VTIGFGQSGNRMTADAFKGIELRNLGPVLSTGRVADIEVDPNNPTRYFAATAVGGLWKSDNRGNTWHSVFDNGGSFNMCCVVIDPKNSNNVWLGTGENSVPRSATYGDGLYKSTDGGETFTRVGLERSEHIGNIKIDPRNSDVVYVAAQGPLWSAGGDRGIYKTTDGGKTWKAIFTISPDTGANDIAIDPNNPDVLYASMWQRRRGVGQMIGGGPESGFFKSTNAGATWTKITKGLPAGDVGRIALGVDPKAKPTRVYALLNGLAGESGFYRSDDAGLSFERMGAPYGKPGAPEGTASPCDNPAGRRGGGAAAADAAAPTGAAANPATPPAGAAAAPPAGRGARGRGAQTATPPANAAAQAGQAGAAGAGAAGAAGAQGAPPAGFGGRGGCAVGAYCGGDPGYYQEIFVDPIRPDTIWSANTNLEWSHDGGRCWSPVPNMGSVHVDFHSVWADPKDRLHILVANDGGAYESWDEGKTWRHFDNLPVTQFYRVAVDDAQPFYNVCGGAQDNESQCGPSRTMNRVGIRLSDWWMIGGCDGFTSRIEPGDPNIVYTSCQSGGVSRLDLRTGVNKSIRPGGANLIPNPEYPAPPPEAAGAGGRGGGGGGGGGRGGGGDRTNWDAPYIISPFSPARLYWGSDKLYRSDDRGDHWMVISPDLSRNLNPDVIPIMGKIWARATTVAYNNATTPLSNIVSVDESPLMEGLIYVGTDDGLLQVTEDAGKTWRRTEKFADFPEGIYVTSVRASPRDSNVVFATLNNWQRGDFKPYIVRSDDRGKTFKSINGDFPSDRMDAFSIVQDHVNGNLLFVGAEFGLFFTVDGGNHWVQLKGGLPTIQVRDLAIQKRESDLVLGTFGRGFYVLDDYSALREVTPEAMNQEAALFPLRHAYAFDELSYIQAAWGNYTTPNPPSGATFTYNVGSNFSGNLVMTIADENGRDVCRMDVPKTDGLHRVTWNLRVSQPGQGGGRGGGGGGGGGGRGGGGNTIACAPIGAAANAQPAPAAGPGGGGGFGRGGATPMVANGRYTATLGKLDGDKATAVGKPQSFQVLPLPAKNW
jgi:photosystem II stability/assembly factor-like uncharacterized protein